MPDFVTGSETPIGGLTESLGYQAIIERRLEATALLERLIVSGEIDPPCNADCEGFIVVRHDDGNLWGACPVIASHAVCVIPAKHRQMVSEEMRGMGWPYEYVYRAAWDRCRVEAEVRSWLGSRDRNEGLLLHGPVGTGKTMTMSLAARELWDRDLQCRFVQWSDVTRRLADRQAGDGDLLDRAARADVLCIDDFGVGSIAPWVIGMLDWLFEIRNGAGRPIMLTTNLTPETLKSDPDFGRMVDRMRERMARIMVGGVSQRVG